MKLDIFLYGDPVLRQKCAEICEVRPELNTLVENMFETMYYHRGLGLAAPQVGEAVRVAIVHVPNEPHGKIILINPVIKEKKGSAVFEEGCLCFPDLTAPVERAVEVTFETTTLSGKKRTMMVTGVTAQAVQHETDHLDGVLFIDRLGTARRALLAGKLRRLRKRGEKGERR
jgi:peptide deformylase